VRALPPSIALVAMDLFALERFIACPDRAKCHVPTHGKTPKGRALPEGCDGDQRHENRSAFHSYDALRDGASCPESCGEAPI